MNANESVASSPSIINARLSTCEVCGANGAKYTCPKCEVKTCSLNCVNIHKKEIECDGIRDRTKFIYSKNFSALELRSDYTLLEECSRFLYGKRRNIEKKYTHIDKQLPPHLSRLKRAAYSRGTVLLLVLEHFTRRRTNSSRLVRNTLIWRVEWVFPNAAGGAVKLCDARCDENKRLSSLLHKYFDPEADGVSEGMETLVYYQAAGLSGVRIFLKAERMKGCAKKFYELDAGGSLRENLAGKCIVEFPVIFVILKDHSYDVDIVQSDDEEAVSYDSKKFNKPANHWNKDTSYDRHPQNNDIVMESAQSQSEDRFKNTDSMYDKDTPETANSSSEFQYSKIQRPIRELATAKFAREEKLKLEKEIVEEMKKKPKNLLFVTGYSSDEEEFV